MSQATSIPTRSFGFYLNGDSHSRGREFVVSSPYDHQPIAVVYEATNEDVEIAIRSAVEAFAVTRKMSSFQRSSVLRKVADGIRQRREEFARTICQEAGKPIKTSRIEVDRGIYTFEVAAEEATRMYGEYIPLDTLESTAGRWGLLRRFPLGPVFAITPFNFPLNLVAHKVAPAIAAGCPLILKPAPQTPVTALTLAEVVHDAGWPEGALGPSGIMDDFGQHQRCNWSLRSRLKDQRTTGGDGRRDLMRHKVERKVEGCDGKDRAKRKATAQSPAPGSGFERVEGDVFAVNARSLLGGDLKGVDTAVDFDSCRLDRLSRLVTDSAGEF